MTDSRKKLLTIVYSVLLVSLAAVVSLLVIKRYRFVGVQNLSTFPSIPSQTENEYSLESNFPDNTDEEPDQEETAKSEIYLFGKNVSTEETYLDLSAFSSSEIESEINNLAEMKSVSEINFLKTDGTCSVGTETLDKIRDIFPNALLDCSFELFGKTVSSKDTRIEYVKEEIGNEGADAIRAVLPYLSSCEYFLLDTCGIDNEVLAQLRDDFPERNIVWRIFMKGYDSYLTDITVFRCTKICDEDNDQFKYCSAIKYIDVGHTLHHLTDISFVKYMPNLEVLILAHTNVSDISALAYCKNLEYLEIFYTFVSDLSPLAECDNLQHLNMSRAAKIKDLSPLYGLKHMKRLRLDYWQFPQEQLDTITRLMPECAMEFGDGDDILGGWRYYLNKGVPEISSRYALLRKQLHYDDGDVYVG